MLYSSQKNCQHIREIIGTLENYCELNLSWNLVQKLKLISGFSLWVRDFLADSFLNHYLIVQYLAARGRIQIFPVRDVDIFVDIQKIFWSKTFNDSKSQYSECNRPQFWMFEISETFLPILLWRHQRIQRGIGRFKCMRCEPLLLQLWQRSRLNIEFS